MFLRPGMRAGRFGVRIAGRGASLAMSALERITGVALLRDLSEFFVAFEGMVDGFHDRAAEIARLLGSPRSTFLVVAAPRREAITEAEFFVRCLDERDLPFGGLVANRVSPSPLDDGAMDGAPTDLEELGSSAVDALVAAGVARDVAGRAATALVDAERHAAADRELLRQLADRTGVQPVAVVPRLDHDVVDTSALATLADALGVVPTLRT
jgi:anion-transporting  ArsA/GET3 family ATPase